MALEPAGRFAPSPTGPLHLGSLATALASWLDARAMGARWLVRLEDVDGPRCPHGMSEHILHQLAALGLQPDQEPLRQSTHGHAYQQALALLQQAGWAYRCACTRREVDDTLQGLGLVHQRHGERIYPGTCRAGLHGRTARAWRCLTERPGHGSTVQWTDRLLGTQSQDLAREVGDFVLRRADGIWAYQLAVVVDDAHQGITHVVRGADLADNTARQIWLQRALGLPTPSYLHVPLVMGTDGHKLSKQNGAQSIDLHQPLLALKQAALHLGLPAVAGQDATSWLRANVPLWARLCPAG